MNITFISQSPFGGIRQSLSVVQFKATPRDEFDYLSGEKAISEKLLEVAEVSDQGRVGTLSVVNKSDRHVFFMDGDILIGAKQNRVLNTSILLAPQSTTIVPVSCVERGRWTRSNKPTFDHSGNIAPMNLRFQKSRDVSMNLKRGMGHLSDQSGVWNSVDAYQANFSANSPTDDLSHVFAKVKMELDAFCSTLPAHDDANGVAIFLNKEIASADVMHRRDVYREYFPKLLRAAALDDRPSPQAGGIMTDAEASYKLLDFFDQIEKLERQSFAGAGVGSESRFGSDAVTGFELRFDHHVIHHAVLRSTSVRPRVSEE